MEGPQHKRARHHDDFGADFDAYIKVESPEGFAGLTPPMLEQSISDEINEALLSFDEFHKSSSFSSPNTVVFDSSPENSGSITSHEDDEAVASKHKAPGVDYGTIAALKRSMIDTSKVISTFTTLKTTYLKLCKEFNYLLTMFNDNERIKIELINENNELKRLLTEVITDREADRKELRRLQAQLSGPA